jgi:hypothetical protein
MKAYGGDKYGRTIWINPKGEIIDISLGFEKVGIHFNWIKERYESLFNKKIIDESNDPEITPMKEGWIKIRNHNNNFFLTGKEEYIKKNGKVIFKILDEKIMNGEEFITEIDLFVTEQGLEDGEEHSCIIPSWYDLPEQEYKLKKYGIRQ